MKFSFFRKRLELRNPFTISRGTSQFKENLFVKLECDGIEGWGEVAPNIRYGETTESCLAALRVMTAGLSGSPFDFAGLLPRLNALVEGQFAAKAAVDMAFLDWVGKSLLRPLHRIWGMASPGPRVTSFTLSIGSPEQARRWAREAASYQVLKVKLGGKHDRAMIQSIREETDRVIRVDANEAWHDPESALGHIEWLAQHQVELVEQPMPAASMADMMWLKTRSPLPLVADEACLAAADFPELEKAYHVVNIKLAKCGGLQEAKSMILAARHHGLKVMLGCMVESSLGIAAAAQLSPLADYLDLDGNLLLNRDPFEGHPVHQGLLHLNQKPGLGALPGARACLEVL